MFENLSIGLDIATALSVIAAATAFIWNSIVSKKNELKERKKEIIKSHVFKVADRINEESYAILKETTLIGNRIQEGQMIQDLNTWRDKILELPNSFKQLNPIDDVYCGDGRFKRIEPVFRKELEEFIYYFASLVDPEKEVREKWDFETVMNTPNVITMKYITQLYQETEDYFEKN